MIFTRYGKLFSFLKWFQISESLEDKFNKRFLKFYFFFFAIFCFLAGFLGGNLFVISQTGGHVYYPAATKISDRGEGKEFEKQLLLSEETVITQIFEKVSPSVVSIAVYKYGLGMDNLSKKETGLIGSGFIISPDGIIITSNHVVDDLSANYLVVTKDQKVFPIEKINRNKKNDIAILEISASNLEAIGFGDSDIVKPGQKVIAIGTVLGRFEESVATGVIAGKNRTITAGDPTGISEETVRDVLQIDIALNPGVSGGPLLNVLGEVIGVNFAFTEGAQNIGFAIPANTVKNILNDFYQREGRKTI